MLNNINKKSIAGFSLVETLMAMVIIAIVFVGIMLWMQRTDKRNQAQKIVQEFNMILGASVAYYHDYDHWPAKTQEPINANNPLLKDDYLPNQAINHFGNLYTMQSNTNPDSFQISLCVPDDAHHTWPNLIAPLLPYGGVGAAGTEGCTAGFAPVYAQIGSNNGTNPTFNMVHPGVSITKPTCHGSKPRIFAVPMGFDTGAYPISMFRLIPVESADKTKWKIQLDYMDSYNGKIHSDNPTKTGEDNFPKGTNANNFPILVITACE